MSKIINLTPHDLNICGRDNKIIQTIPSSGIVRVIEKKEEFGDINGIPLVRKRFLESEGLPEPQIDTFYFVSIIVIQANPTRNDLITSSELVRDEKGRILGCKEFSIL